MLHDEPQLDQGYNLRNLRVRDFGCVPAWNYSTGIASFAHRSFTISLNFDSEPLELAIERRSRAAKNLSTSSDVT